MKKLLVIVFLSILILTGCTIQPEPEPNSVENSSWTKTQVIKTQSSSFYKIKKTNTVINTINLVTKNTKVPYYYDYKNHKMYSLDEIQFIVDIKDDIIDIKLILGKSTIRLEIITTTYSLSGLGILEEKISYTNYKGTYELINNTIYVTYNFYSYDPLRQVWTEFKKLLFNEYSYSFVENKISIIYNKISLELERDEPDEKQN